LLNSEETRRADDAGFTRNVMDLCVTTHARRVPFYRSRLAYGSMAVAAAAALWLLRPSLHSELDVVAARGTSSHVVMPVTPDALLLRGSTLLPIQDAELRPGDGITLRYWNPGNEPVYLTAFALDSAATVHWIFPAYTDESQNPTSIRLERSVEGRVLAEAVEPEAPASGRLRIVALLTSQALSVHEVEAKVGQGTQNLKLTFPNARVHEWNCTWNAR
jgi:hypothetical protein